MAFDAGMLAAVLNEISSLCLGAKVEKIFQPTHDEVDLLLKNDGKSHRLVVNVGNNAPRISLSLVAKENPLTPPTFCMLLRKHLTGAKLTKVEQAGFERVAFLTFSAFDEMGYPCEKRLVAEIMGKYSNLILCDQNEKILASAKTVDFSVSRLRQILPGMKYELPPLQEKCNPIEEEKEKFIHKISTSDRDMLAEKFITANYLGTSSQVAREIVYMASGDAMSRLGTISCDAFFTAFSEQMRILKEKDFTPYTVYDKDGVPRDFAYSAVHYLGDADIQRKNSFCELFDEYYRERDRIDKIKQRAADLLHILSNAVSRITRKLELQREELAEAEKGEDFKRRGDLITANIYLLKRGDNRLTAMDYSLDEPCEVTVEIDSRLSPSQNAQRMYKFYNKAKKAREVLRLQISSGEEELRYLETVSAFLEKSETEEDLSELREELYKAGYASRMKNYSPQKKHKIKPLTATTTSGYRLLCGKNNLQNDELTFRIAEKGDIWFHTKNIPGSHVILLCNGEEPPAVDYTEAAEFAAYHSKARENGNAPVAVDYTRVKNLKKPPSAKPGFVIYHTNYTAYVTPKDRKEESGD